MTLLVSTGAAFAAVLALHVLVWRAMGKGAPRRDLVLLTGLFCGGYAALLLAGPRLLGASPQRFFWVSGPVYAFLTVLYLHLYVGMGHSVSIRMLLSLEAAQGRELSFADLERAYPPDERMVRPRLENLAARGWLRRSEGRYACAPFGRFVARVFLLLKDAYGIQVTG